MTVRQEISSLVYTALQRSQQKGILPKVDITEPLVERPQNPTHGDIASSVALKLAKLAHKNPMAIAEELLPLIPKSDIVQEQWIVHPGFINFSLRKDWLLGQVLEILANGHNFGSINLGNHEKVQIEFVSTNPTGPIHLGHARGAVLGSALASIMEAAGYDVTREYYINDAGSQIYAFANSLYIRYLQALGIERELPLDGYPGDYVENMAKDLTKEFGNKWAHVNEQEAIANLRVIGLERMLEIIKNDLATLGVYFDVWFSETSLYQEGQYEKVIDILQKGDYITNRDSAVWFTSSELGDNKDNVLVKSNGAPTYFASDIAYHYNKFVERGFETVIDIWGADHQGHISRMKHATSALGLASDKLNIIISQMVSLKRGEESVKLSKRSGTLITLRDLLNEVGPDPCRFFFLARSPESQMDFDLELAHKQSSDNPVYYIQYAHARIASILAKAAETSIEYSTGNVSILTDPAELALVRKMVQLPELIESMAQNQEPHHLPHYSLELATAFHWFYQQCRVISNDPELTKARLMLTRASQFVLVRCLKLMGMSVPDSM